MSAFNKFPATLVASTSPPPFPPPPATSPPGVFCPRGGTRGDWRTLNSFDPHVMTRGDWSKMPCLQAITLQSVGPIGTYTPYPIAYNGNPYTTLRRALTWKEIAASAGAYTGINQMFDVPDQAVAASLPSGVYPKAGDLLLDFKGVTHTILEAMLGKHGNTWHCTTIALAIVNNLGVTGTLTRPDNTQDAYGRPTFSNYTTIGTSLCRVQPQDSSAGDTMERRTIVTKFTAFLATPLAVRAKDQFSDGTTTYTVLGFRHPQQLDRLLELDLEVVQ